MQVCFLRAREVRSRLGIGNTKFYNDINEGRFPPAVRIGLRATAWPSNEIDAYIARIVAGEDPLDITKALVAGRVAETRK